MRSGGWHALCLEFIINIPVALFRIKIKNFTRHFEMTFTANDLRNSIKFAECVHEPLCCGYRWEIWNEEALAHLVAWTMQGHYWHAEKVLYQLKNPALLTMPSAQQQVINSLILPKGTGNITIRWHRDGLLFQHISWVAAQLQHNGKIATSMPHMRKADKGFDALLIPLNDQREALSGIIFCEDKASDNPRNLITQSVWPEILSIEAGNRDAELTGEISAILRAHNVSNVDDVLTDISWLKKKAYRISLTISPPEDLSGARKKLFDDYEKKAPGVVARRRAETLRLQDLRSWMDEFAVRVIKSIQAT
jgi:hypothetical protein